MNDDDWYGSGDDEEEGEDMLTHEAVIRQQRNMDFGYKKEKVKLEEECQHRSYREGFKEGKLEGIELGKKSGQLKFKLLNSEDDEEKKVIQKKISELEKSKSSCDCCDE